MPANTQGIVCTIVVCVLLLIGPAGDYATREEPVALPLLPELGGCIADPEARTAWQPRFVPADLTRMQRFECVGGTLDVRIIVWFEQRSGREAVSEENHVTTTEQRFTTTLKTVATPSGVPVIEHDVRLDEERLIIWTGYAVGSHATGGDFATKWREGLNAAMLQPAPTALIAIAAQSADDEHAHRLLSTHADPIWSWYRALVHRS